MDILFSIVGVIVAALIIFIAYRFFKVKAQTRKFKALRFDRIKPLYDKLESGSELSAGDVLPFAENILTRQDTFQLLKELDKLALFPEAYFTLTKGAEGALAVWLEFPTELDACPDEIEHLKRVTINFDGSGNFVHYEVFQYRTNAPHWASKDGWILGVVGPYFDDSNPYDLAQATFSRVSSTAAKVSPEEEVNWVHKNISMRA